MTDTLLAAWRFEAQHDSFQLIIPDGCRDLILRQPAQGRAHWFVSSLDDCIRQVPVSRGEVFSGYRLKPGTILDEAALLASLPDDTVSHDVALSRLDDFTRLCDSTTEALTCLALCPGRVEAVATRLGVGLRTLQRTVLSKTGRSPVYWRQLARVRRAGRAVCGDGSLADIAAEFGFADQAHMSRELKRWLGVGAALLRRGCAQRGPLFQSGYA